MVRVRKQPAKPIIATTKSPPKRKRGRPPKKKLAAPIQAIEKDTNCIVCLDTTRCRKMKSLLCNHTFHEQCINKWLETNEVCPLCRMRFEQKKPKSVRNRMNYILQDIANEALYMLPDSDPANVYLVTRFTLPW